MSHLSGAAGGSDWSSSSGEPGVQREIPGQNTHTQNTILKRSLNVLVMFGFLMCSGVWLWFWSWLCRKTWSRRWRKVRMVRLQCSGGNSWTSGWSQVSVGVCLLVVTESSYLQLCVHVGCAGGAAEPVGSMEIVALACRCLDRKRKKRPAMKQVRHLSSVPPFCLTFDTSAQFHECFSLSGV